MITSKIPKIISVIVIGIISSLIATFIWDKIFKIDRDIQTLIELTEWNNKHNNRNTTPSNDIPLEVKCISNLFNTCKGKTYVEVIDKNSNEIIEKYTSKLVNHLNKFNHNIHSIDDNIFSSKNKLAKHNNFDNLLIIHFKKNWAKPTDSIELDESINSKGMFSASISADFRLYKNDSLLNSCLIDWNGIGTSKELAEMRAFNNILSSTKPKR